VVKITPRPRFYPRGRTPGTIWIGGWVDLRAGLNTEARGNIICLCIAEDYTYCNSKFVYFMRFQALTAASMKLTAFWSIAPCGLVEIDRRFRDAYCLRHQGYHGGSKHLWNVGLLQRDYTSQYPRNCHVCVLFLPCGCGVLMKCGVALYRLQNFKGQCKQWVEVCDYYCIYWLRFRMILISKAHNLYIFSSDRPLPSKHRLSSDEFFSDNK
jgi:hypothetical protein